VLPTHVSASSANGSIRYGNPLWGLNGMAFESYDLDLLTFCRDPYCDRQELHAAHGSSARTITTRRSQVTVQLGELQTVCGDCGFLWEVWASACTYCGSIKSFESIGHPANEPVTASEGLIESTYAAIGLRVPKPFAEVWQTVVNDYGAITDRGVQRALRVLVDQRRVASLTHAEMAPATRRAPNVRAPGFYIRYDSPRLWSPGGLRDLMTVAADRMRDEVFRG
jgi:hypothetical protein